MVENPRAFPGGNKSNIDGRVANGMTLRDWFAGQALPTLVATTDKRVTPEIIAQVAFQMADAMLTERSK